jgi:hypothetical protein
LSDEKRKKKKKEKEKEKDVALTVKDKEKNNKNNNNNNKNSKNNNNNKLTPQQPLLPSLSNTTTSLANTPPPKFKCFNYESEKYGSTTYNKRDERSSERRIV